MEAINEPYEQAVYSLKKCRYKQLYSRAGFGRCTDETNLLTQSSIKPGYPGYQANVLVTTPMTLHRTLNFNTQLQTLHFFNN